MQDIAADCDNKPFDPALVAADGQGIEKRLGRMFVSTVTGIDHGTVDLSCQKFHRA